MSALEMPKKKPMSRERLIGNDALLSLFYLGVDAASARIAIAASSVMSFPLSLLWMVIREIPRSLATSVGVPIDSRMALYSLAVIVSVNDLENLANQNDRLRAVVVRDARKVVSHNLKLSAVPIGIVKLFTFEVLFDLADFFVGHFVCDINVHGLVCLGLGRSHWRRGERKIFLRSRQELSVKYFYAPFLRLNAPDVERRDPAPLPSDG